MRILAQNETHFLARENGHYVYGFIASAEHPTQPAGTLVAAYGIDDANRIAALYRLREIQGREELNQYDGSEVIGGAA